MTVSADDVRRMFESVKNWGRWGADDERGALNLITPDKIRDGAAAVRTGLTISCARNLAVEPAIDNPHPALHMMTRAGDDCIIHDTGAEITADFVGVAFHGMATTHLDALCHVLVDQQMYNGFPASEIKSTGARRGSVMCAKDGIVSRGVLLDIPRLWGKPWVELGTAIRIEDLEAAERLHQVRVSPGDILLVNTGRDARRAAKGPWRPILDGMAGLHLECAQWLRDRDVAVLGSDSVHDVYPAITPPPWTMPIHQCALVAMGVHLLDNLDLGALAETCANRSQYVFQFVIAPLRVDKGTGSPCNPLAIL